MKRYLTRAAPGVLVVLVFLLHTLGYIKLPLVDRLEFLSYDLRLRLTAPGGVDPRIVIVDIDERSLREQGHWPWDRGKLARLVDNLFTEYRVAVVGFDVVFAERDENQGLNELKRVLDKQRDAASQSLLTEVRQLLQRDTGFARSLQGRRVILGYVFGHDPQQTENSGVLPPPVFARDSIQAQLIPALHMVNYTGNLPELQRVAGGGFFNNPLVGLDGVFRRVPLLLEHGGALYESLGLAVVRAYLGELPEPVMAEGAGGMPVLEWLRLGHLHIPVDEDVAVLVPYRGPQGSFPYVSATEVLRKVPGLRETLRDALVLVGTTAPGLFDMRTTPMQNVYPGVEVHANLIAGILDQRIKQRPGYTLGAELVVLMLVGLCLALTLPRLNPLWSALTCILVTAGVLAGNLYIWESGNLVLPLAPILLLILMLFMLSMVYGFFIESRTKRLLGTRFGQYVPHELVKQMSKDPERYSLESEKREMTVLFADIRGFTRFSEGLDPKALSLLLNEYLTPMTRIIHGHRGTIDKYMGDAVMAFWGAPLHDDRHAANAVLAALDMAQQLVALQQEFQERGWPTIRIGIGINTGLMSVGNMGSQFRMAYTVLGDAVNLASRLENLCRVYDVVTIVSESTMRATPDIAYRELDRVRVKGRDQPVTIYEPLGIASKLSENMRVELLRYQQALQHYHARDWDAATDAFQALSTMAPDVRLYRLYVERIVHLRANPPPPEWDGVYQFQGDRRKRGSP